MSICRRAFIHDLACHYVRLSRQTASVASISHRRTFPDHQMSSSSAPAVLSKPPVRAASTNNPSSTDISDTQKLSLRLEALTRRRAPSPQKKKALEVGPRGITLAEYKVHSKSSSSASTQFLSQLPLASYLFLLDVLSEQRSAKWINALLRDILFIYAGPRIDKIQVITKVITTIDFRLVSPRNVFIMTRFLSRSLEGKKSLQHFLEPLIRKVAQDLISADGEGALLKYLQGILMENLKALPPSPVNVDPLSFQPPALVDAAFYFIRKLISVHNQPAALDIFQLLVELNHVPQEVQTGTTTVPDFEIVAISSLVRACIHWRRRSLALELLNHLLVSKLSSDVGQEQMYDLAVATIMLCLQVPVRDELLQVLRLIKHLHDTIPVADSVIRQFYHAASVIEYGEAAGKLYMFCRQPHIQDEHQYPPPQDRSILMLMEYLSRTGHLHYMRLLVQEAIDGALHLPYHCRADFISHVISRGIAGPARILWQRYSTAGDVIKGNPRLMLRMVSAFTHLARKLSKSTKTPAGNKNDAAKDCAVFAKHVLQEYRKLQHPGQATAHHFALNALARAYMIVGDFSDGFEILRILVKRHHAPDLADVNVALSYFAEHSPVQAARLLGLMIERGLSPNGRTFGTVIHWAAKRGNNRLVTTLLKQARDCGVELTDQTIASLLRHLVTPQIMRSLAVPDRYQRLQEVLNIMQTDARKLEYVCTPQLGKYLVFASLRIGSGLLAFKFWSLLMKNREQSGDREQIFIQQLIRRFTRDRRVVKGMRKGD